MEFQKVIEARQSIRKFKKGSIPKDDLYKIVKAAGIAPSGKNSQNWHFLVIQNEALIRKVGETVKNKNESICLEMDKIDKSRGDTFRNFVKNLTLFFVEAPVIVLVFTTDYKPSGYYELQFINASQDILDELELRKSPGMQSLGAALQNFSLKTVELGYGSCWLTSINYAGREIEALLKEEIGFEKEDYFLAALMAVGIPEEGQNSPNKKPVEQIMTYIE